MEEGLSLQKMQICMRLFNLGGQTPKRAQSAPPSLLLVVEHDPVAIVGNDPPDAVFRQLFLTFVHADHIDALLALGRRLPPVPHVAARQIHRGQPRNIKLLLELDEKGDILPEKNFPDPVLRGAVIDLAQRDLIVHFAFRQFRFYHNQPSFFLNL